MNRTIIDYLMGRIRNWRPLRRCSCGRFLVACAVLLAVTGCEMAIELGTPAIADQRPTPECPYKSLPPVDLPEKMRTSNWGGGSCLHAAFCDLLKWQGYDAEAAEWRRTYAGAAGIGDIARIANGLNLDFAYTDSGDEAFLDWASRTRRGAAVYCHGGRHAITFCGYVGDEAVVVDNNYTDKMQRRPKAEFLREWHAAGGCAITLVDAPAPPRPWM